MAVVTIELSLVSGQCSRQEATSVNVPAARVEIRVNHYESSVKEFKVDYSVISKSRETLFLVADPRLPFLRLTTDSGSVEIWVGVPPRTTAEQNRLVNMLVLPSTEALPPGSILNKTVVAKFPLKLSGYWLEDSEETPLPLDGHREITAILIQGYGLSALDPRQIRSIQQLFTWQLTERSHPFTLTLPPHSDRSSSHPR
jgi:hypothetical protein